MSKILKVTPRGDAPTERTRQPLRGNNRNNQGVAPTRSSFEDRPRQSYDDKPRAPYGDRSDRPQRSSEDRPRRDGDSAPRRDFGDRPRPSYNDKPRAPYGDRAERSDRPQRSSEDRPRRDGDSAPRRDFGDRPRPSYNDKPRAPYGDRAERSDRPQRSSEDRPRRDGDSAPRRDFGDRPRPSYNDKPRAPYGDRAERSDRPQRSSEDRPRRDGDSAPRRDFGDRPRPSYNDKPRTPYGDRAERSDRPQRSSEDRPRRDGDSAPRRDFGDRPRPSFNDKPRTPYGDRAERSDRPQRSSEDRPRRDSGSSDKPRYPRREVTESSREASAYAASRGREPRATDRDPNAGIRLSKHLTETGVCSRREADHYIEKGWVTVNGKRAVLGQRILPTDKVQLARQLHTAQERRMTILLHKPVGFVSGQAEDGYTPAANLIEPSTRWEGDTTDHVLENVHVRGMAPAGRLDIDSTGLLVLTQDGRVAKALVGEKSSIDKEYLVRVIGTLDEGGLELLNHGLIMDEVALRPAKVTWQNEDQLRFVLSEGKKRQIRRMCEMVGLEVVGLKRIRIGNIVLGDLPVGQWRYLRDDEVF